MPDDRIISYTIIGWVVALFLVMLMAGCAKHEDPASSINNQLQQDVAQLIDYADNNMTDDADIRLLKTGLKDCAARADAVTKQHETSIAACEAKTDKAKSERNALIVFFLLLLGIKLFNLRL